ncbi:hypothetical protein B0H19DRAFT_1252281 [Mycena capillaripes]|nr:hypothetical protein B0H19DRAFT_1252281 [Mycena capillaripes]
MSTTISYQETRRLFGPLNRPDFKTNVRHRAVLRKARDSEVWVARADREERLNGGVDGAATFARMQAPMYQRLEHNAEVVFKSPESGAHHDQVSATAFDELVTKIDGWRGVVFKWMDDMDIHRAYKGF